MNAVTVKAVWSEDMHTCSITIARGLDAHTYYNLRTKKVNLRDYKEPEVVYSVKIPCKDALGEDYMLCCGHDTIYNYKHPEYQLLILRMLDDDEIIDIPQRKKGKKHAEHQLSLFSAAAEREAREGEAS